MESAAVKRRRRGLGGACWSGVMIGGTVKLGLFTAAPGDCGVVVGVVVGVARRVLSWANIVVQPNTQKNKKVVICRLIFLKRLIVDSWK